MMVLIGFHSISFAVFSKVFATQEGLRRPTRSSNASSATSRWKSAWSSGWSCSCSASPAHSWPSATGARRTFGPLDPSRVLRIVIPSSLALTMGCEVILVSFFLSILGLRIRRLERVPGP